MNGITETMETVLNKIVGDVNKLLRYANLDEIQLFDFGALYTREEESFGSLGERAAKAWRCTSCVCAAALGPVTATPPARAASASASRHPAPPKETRPRGRPCWAALGEGASPCMLAKPPSGPLPGLPSMRPSMLA